MSRYRSQRTRLLCLVVTFLVTLPVATHATWSIVVLDPETLEIGVAGASCSYSVWGIQAVEPGVGVIVTQAASNPRARQRGLEMIREGREPSQIIAAITDPIFDPTFDLQQHAVLTFAHPAQALFTGARNPDYAAHMSTPGISVQGNTLVSREVLEQTLAVFRTSAGEPLIDRLLAALAAGGEAGGDARCGDQHATSAFAAIYGPDESDERPGTVGLVYGRERGGEDAVKRLLTELRPALEAREPGERVRVVIEP
jgi:uncharacterized Ntn-hydrolase superfamily protein